MEYFEQFEAEIMKNIISENVEISDMLKKQYESAKIISREFTGFGFYTNFIVEDEDLRLQNNLNLELGNIQVELSGLKYGIGFVLFVRSGFIKVLEGYTYDEPWPEKITGYIIH